MLLFLFIFRRIIVIFYILEVIYFLLGETLVVVVTVLGLGTLLLFSLLAHTGIENSLDVDFKAEFSVL